MAAPVLDPADDTALDPAVAAWPLPADEEARVAARYAFGVLDQPRRTAWAPLLTRDGHAIGAVCARGR